MVNPVHVDSSLAKPKPCAHWVLRLRRGIFVHPQFTKYSTEINCLLGDWDTRTWVISHPKGQSLLNATRTDVRYAQSCR